MNLPISFTPPQLNTEPPAMVRVVSHEDMAWSSPPRPIFRAPPIEVAPPLADIAAFTSQLRRAS